QSATGPGPVTDRTYSAAERISTSVTRMWLFTVRIPNPPRVGPVCDWPGSGQRPDLLGRADLQIRDTQVALHRPYAEPALAQRLGITVIEDQFAVAVILHDAVRLCHEADLVRMVRFEQERRLP